MDNIRLYYIGDVFATVPVDTKSGYRFGFGGQEKDIEVYGDGNSYTAEFWEYDPRTARRWNMDFAYNPLESPYLVFHDNPIFFNDPSGAWPPGWVLNWVAKLGLTGQNMTEEEIKKSDMPRLVKSYLLIRKAINISAEAKIKGGSGFELHGEIGGIGIGGRYDEETWAVGVNTNDGLIMERTEGIQGEFLFCEVSTETTYVYNADGRIQNDPDIPNDVEYVKIYETEGSYGPIGGGETVVKDPCGNVLSKKENNLPNVNLEEGFGVQVFVGFDISGTILINTDNVVNAVVNPNGETSGGVTTKGLSNNKAKSSASTSKSSSKSSSGTSSGTNYLQNTGSLFGKYVKKG